jgi:hypothetical protein
MKVAKIYSSDTAEESIVRPPDPPRPLTTRAEVMHERCKVATEEDGTAVVTFRVDPFIMARVQRRAGNMDVATYMYENILYRACVDHVY